MIGAYGNWFKSYFLRSIKIRMQWGCTIGHLNIDYENMHLIKNGRPPAPDRNSVTMAYGLCLCATLAAIA